MSKVFSSDYINKKDKTFIAYMSPTPVSFFTNGLC